MVYHVVEWSLKTQGPRTALRGRHDDLGVRRADDALQHFEARGVEPAASRFLLLCLFHPG